MNDYHIYQLVYLLIVSIATFIAIGGYKAKIIPNFAVYYSRKSNWKYSSALILAIAFILLIGLRAEDGQFADSLNYRTYYYTFYEGVPFHFDRNAENVLFDNLFAWWGSCKLGVSSFFFLMASLYFGCMLVACMRFFPKDTYIGFLCYLAAFSTFSYSCNGIKAGAAASIFLLAVSYYRNWAVCIPLMLISWGFHHSMVMPIAAFVISHFYRNPKHFFYAWAACVLMSALHVSYFQMFFASLAAESGDSHGANYLLSTSASEWGGKAGFRIDFLIYSAMPVIVGYIAVFKKNLQSNMYNLLLRLYLTTNAIWLLCMYVEFNNRIAYLSWLLYPIVLIYPFLNLNWSRTQLKLFSQVTLYHLGFTLFMNLIYYGGLRKLLGI